MLELFSVLMVARSVPSTGSRFSGTRWVCRSDCANQGKDRKGLFFGVLPCVFDFDGAQVWARAGALKGPGLIEEPVSYGT